MIIRLRPYAHLYNVNGFVNLSKYYFKISKIYFFLLKRYIIFYHSKLRELKINIPKIVSYKNEVSCALVVQGSVFKK